MDMFLTSGKSRVQVSSAHKPVEFKAYTLECASQKRYAYIKTCLESQGNSIFERCFKTEGDLTSLSSRIPRWAR